MYVRVRQLDATYRLLPPPLDAASSDPGTQITGNPVEERQYGIPVTQIRNFGVRVRQNSYAYAEIRVRVIRVRVRTEFWRMRTYKDVRGRTRIFVM